jgi:RNA polymerase sigma-70 factor (ECF subfamily)
MRDLALSYNTDADIIKDYCESNSDRAATAFVRKYQSFVYATAYRYLNNHDDADDAAQEAFIRALGNLHKFKAEAGVKTWLYRITVNVCLNIQRKKKVRSIFKIFDDNDPRDIPLEKHLPDRDIQIKEFEERFLDALSDLPKKQRETFALRYFDEMSYEEISNVLGTSVGGLKANYHQAVKKLSAFFAKEEI